MERHQVSGDWLSLEQLAKSVQGMLARKREHELEQEDDYFGGSCPTCGQKYHGRKANELRT